MNGTFLVQPLAGFINLGRTLGGIPPIQVQTSPLAFGVPGDGSPADIQFVPNGAPEASRWALWIWATRLNGFGLANPPVPANVQVAFARTQADLPSTAFPLSLMRTVWVPTSPGEISYILDPSRSWARFQESPASAVGSPTGEASFSYYIERML